MTKILSSIEVSCVVKELQTLIGGKVDKVHQPTKDEVILAIHKTGIGKSMIRLVPGQCMYITEKKLASPKKAFNFCMFLRKRITNTRLRKIEQKNFERIVEFTFEGKDSRFLLIAEFFSKGNVILCQDDYTIISALEVQRWKDRQIKAREKYAYPPNTNLDIFGMEKDEFIRIIDSTDRDSIVKTLAIDIGLGGLYAEEICLRSGIDKSKKSVTKSESLKLFRELKNLSELDIHAHVLDSDAVPFNMQSYSDKKSHPAESYNSALDTYYSRFMIIEEKDPYKEKIEEQERILESQESLISQLEKGISENNLKGELIYSNYQQVKEVIDTIKMARDRKISWEEIESKLKSKGIIVKGREGKITLDLK